MYQQVVSTSSPEVEDELTKEMAKHDDIDGLWYFGSAEGSKDVELLSAENLKAHVGQLRQISQLV
jgi:tryptophan synthase alpha subunit